MFSVKRQRHKSNVNDGTRLFLLLAVNMFSSVLFYLMVAFRRLNNGWVKHSKYCQQCLTLLVKNQYLKHGRTMFKYYLRSKPWRSFIQISVLFTAALLHLWWCNCSVLEKGFITVREQLRNPTAREWLYHLVYKN